MTDAPLADRLDPEAKFRDLPDWARAALKRQMALIAVGAAGALGLLLFGLAMMFNHINPVFVARGVLMLAVCFAAFLAAGSGAIVAAVVVLDDWAGLLTKKRFREWFGVSLDSLVLAHPAPYKGATRGFVRGLLVGLPFAAVMVGVGYLLTGRAAFVMPSLILAIQPANISAKAARIREILRAERVGS